ncbi:unnamed protein product, partial [Adineta ricciae]
MAWITRFDDLPDLFFIELFHYLTSFDILWSLINLNNRIQQLIYERGFFRRIDLSSASLYKFDKVLTRLPLPEIQTLAINVEASPLQLSHFPYLPHLTTLRIYGLRELQHANTFILRHSHSLERLTLQTNDIFQPDLGLSIDTGLPLWHPTIENALNYLCIPLQHVKHLCQLMSLEKLSTTLQELHVAMRSFHDPGHDNVRYRPVLCKMINLHSFSFIQSIYTDNGIKWSDIEYLTSQNVMPVLRQMKFILFITAADLDSINRSTLFTDDRQIDIQFAFIMDENSFASQLNENVPNGSRFHRRQTVGITCTKRVLTREWQHLTDLDCYFDRSPSIFHIRYTLPWAFDRFFALSEPFVYITKVETLVPSQCISSIFYSSQLRTLSMAQKDSLPSIVSMPHVVQFDRINTIYLSFHAWPSGLNFPNLHHLILTN